MNEISVQRHNSLGTYKKYHFAHFEAAAFHPRDMITIFLLGAASARWNRRDSERAEGEQSARLWWRGIAIRERTRSKPMQKVNAIALALAPRAGEKGSRVVKRDRRFRQTSGFSFSLNDRSSTFPHFKLW